MNSTFITSYERDNETELDFAQARMHNYNHGRFTSPDPLLSSGRIENPQSWNRYIYVFNNPLKWNDKTGLFAWSEALGGEATNKELEKQRKAAKKAGNTKEYDRLDKVLTRRSSIVGAIKDARDAAKKLTDKDDRKKVESALNSYGDPGKDNGVTVGIADEKSITTGGAFTQVENSGQILVAFFEIQIDNAQDYGLFTAVAHEGVHVQGAQAWLASGCGDSSNPTMYQSEFDAYTVSSLTAQGGGLKYLGDGGNTVLWNESWAVNDRQKLRDAGVNSQLQNLGYYDGKKPTTGGSALSLPGKNLKWR